MVRYLHYFYIITTTSFIAVGNCEKGGSVCEQVISRCGEVISEMETNQLIVRHVAAPAPESYTVKSLDCGTEYVIYVIGKKEVGDSQRSNMVSVKTIL